MHTGAACGSHEICSWNPIWRETSLRGALSSKLTMFRGFLAPLPAIFKECSERIFFVSATSLSQRSVYGSFYPARGQSVTQLRCVNRYNVWWFWKHVIPIRQCSAKVRKTHRSPTRNTSWPSRWTWFRSTQPRFRCAACTTPPGSSGPKSRIPLINWRFWRTLNSKY